MLTNVRMQMCGLSFWVIDNCWTVIIEADLPISSSDTNMVQAGPRYIICNPPGQIYWVRWCLVSWEPSQDCADDNSNDTSRTNVQQDLMYPNIPNLIQLNEEWMMLMLLFKKPTEKVNNVCIYLYLNEGKILLVCVYSNKILSHKYVLCFKCVK